MFFQEIKPLLSPATTKFRLQMEYRVSIRGYGHAFNFEQPYSHSSSRTIRSDLPTSKPESLVLSLRSRNASRTRYRGSTRRSSTPKTRTRLAHETLDLHPPTPFLRTSDHSVCASVPNSSLERFQTKPQIANRSCVVVWRVERFCNGVIGSWMLPGKLPCNGSSQYRSVQVTGRTSNIAGDSLV